MIHPSATVEDGVRIGHGTRIWHYAHIRSGASIGDNCTLGKDVFIDRNVLIGNNCKIQNGVSVFDGVTIADQVFVGPHVAFTNDRNPRAFGPWEKVTTMVKRGASIGANATIVCGVDIGEYAMVGAGAVVTHDVPDFGLVVGNPSRLIGRVRKCGHQDLGERHCPKCGAEPPQELTED